MPDLYDDLVAFRPSGASELLPPETPGLVVRAVHTSRRRRALAVAAAGTALVVVVGAALWQLVPLASSPPVASTPSVASPSATTSSTGVPTSPTPPRPAVVVTTPTPLSAAIEPRPITNRRVATGLMLLQVDGKPLSVCVGAIAQSYPVQCGSTVIVTGVTLDQITWKEKVGTTTFAAVDVVGVLSGTGLSSTLAVEQIGPMGTILVTSDSPSPDFAPPTMACLRSSDLGGVDLEANGLERVAGYQAAWTDGQRFNVATLADPLTVENQVRALGYRGPLCVGTLPAPAQSELLSAQQSVASIDGLLMTSISLNGSLHLEVAVLAATDSVVERVRALVRGTSPSAVVVVTPQFLTIT